MATVKTIVSMENDEYRFYVVILGSEPLVFPLETQPKARAFYLWQNISDTNYRFKSAKKWQW